MKRKFILFLLVSCLCVAMLGVTGCKKNKTSEQEPVTIAQIQAKNTLDQVLASNANVVVKTSVASQTEICFSKNAEGKIVVDSKEGEADYTSLRNGAIYEIGTENRLEICPDADHADCCIYADYADLASVMTGTNPTEKDGKYVFTSQKDGVTYEFVANKDTLLLEKADVLVAVEGVNQKVESLTFKYGETVDWIGRAYEELTTAENEEDLLTFEVMFYPLTDKQRSVNLVVEYGVDIDFVETEESTYYFYKNVSCTMDIEDLDELLADYNDVRVYANDYHIEISFEFTLTQEDADEFATIIENFTTLAETSTDFDEIEFAKELMEDKMSYFVHQYYMGQIQYYYNTSNKEASNNFDFAVETYNDAYVDYIDAYKFVYELENNEYSEWLFEDWTEEDLAILKQDNESISALEKRNTEIEQEYNALKRTSSTWSADVEALYEEFVANNQEIARLSGYANAYEHMSKDRYSRNYTAEEREVLKACIRDYIITYSAKASSTYSKINNSMSKADKNAYNEIMQSSVTSMENQYISGYINSYDNSLRNKMRAVYDKNACLFATSGKSMGTAFANYSGYYEEAFVFFGQQYQNVLTFIHELGHYVSFSGYDAGMPYDFAETHSQGNEWMFLHYIKGKVNDNVQGLLVYDNLNSAFNTMIRGMLIDEFEYRVYTAETPYTADQYKTVFTDVLAEFGFPANYITMYYKNYTQLVIINSPCYYLNYVTSSMASLGFYILAETEGYEYAQEVYRKLQEDCNTELPYGEIVESIGLPSPFAVESYEMLIDVFFPEEE
ncbi:MAG: hypothetical protein IKA99_02105 [Clostridia bacterium]|nr:hypothetical protein [Clostridia bacterium]